MAKNSATEPHAGDIIMVSVNGREFVTVISESGVQRFKENTAVKAFIDASTANFETWLRSDRTAPQPYSLNTLAVEHADGKHSLDDLIILYTNIGYSVTGFADVTADWGIEIRNPLWEKSHYRKLSGQAWGELMGLVGHEYKHNGNESVKYIFDTVSSGKWGTDSNGNYVAKTDTIDRVVHAYFDKHEIEEGSIVVKQDTSEELKAFLTHLQG